MGTLIVHPKNKEQLSVLKAFMKALKISFEEDKDEIVSKKDKVSEPVVSYDPEFVKKIKRGEEEFKSGKFTAIKTKDLWK